MSSETTELFNVEIFTHQFTAIIAGPTGCGKTCLLTKILKDTTKFIINSPSKIYYCYAHYQDIFDCSKHQVEFVKGLVNIDELDPTFPNLIIYDDLMDECQNDKSIEHLFTRGSHHKNISVIMLTQNIFNKGKFSRTINLNSHYTILFNNPRDRTQIRYLAREMYPENSKFLIEAFNDATKSAHGYIFIDNKQETNDKIRVQSNIIDEIRSVYVNKKLNLFHLNF